ncbi:death-associated inhibitor of apoptosis 2 [Toxorhynchites rutilus septentrionalis]|uniref:death-associated inhibitor of apoptosis 2 n=1 Tax=Toxorhynchites rutilus septentrionalis TaxID=329112 RepID=UPI0024798E67|nr:death-associated inhibitor of apoptosis 2 [Toxorhynchites rutilus septentrionalis]
MNVEFNRRRTYNEWEHAEWTMENPFDVLAKAGFYATDQFLQVKCHFCGVSIFLGNSAFNIHERHRVVSPNCNFLLNPEATDNVRNFSANELKREECRLATFVNWPVAHISPNALATAGFYYIHNADQVKCAWCEGVIGQWEVGDDPFTEHRKFFPNCVKVISYNISSNPVLDASIGIQPVKAPHAPQFSSLDSRVRSFENWAMSHVQDPERLSQAGFYYLGRADEVHCFYCDGGLRFWLADDDPWFEHARCFPKCQFVQLVKGQLFIENVQSQIKNNGSSQQQQQMQIGTQNNVTMSLDEALGTEPVQLALSMGLNAGRIRAVTKRQLETTGQPFAESQALIEAVLDGQIQDEELEPTTSSRVDRRIENGVSRLLWTAISSSADPNLSSFSSTFSTPSPTVDPAAQDASVSSPSLPPTSSLVNTTIGVDCKNVPEQLQQMQTSDKSDPTVAIVEDDKTHLLEEENKRLKEARECKICMADEVGVVFCPCGHLVSCVQCAPAVTNCPVCRAAIKGRVRTFLS